MRRSKKADFLIMALICLLILNIGNLIMRLYITNNSSDNLKESNVYTFVSAVNTVTKTFKLDKLFGKVINSLFPAAEVLNPDVDRNPENVDDNMDEFNETDEFHYNYEEDIIIEKLDEYESLIIIKDSQGTDKIENIPEPLMISKLKVDRNKPYILIYHTHTTESYKIAEKDNYRSTDQRYNMINIGSIISTILKANGHNVEHVDTYHDLPSYNQSYARSYNTIRKKMEESDNIKILFDIHRDAMAENSPNIDEIKKKSKIEIEGKDVATFSLIVGPDSPNYDKVLNFAKYIKAVSDALYPNLCTGIIIKPAGKYNQHVSDYSALIEVGYNFNTIEEASEGAKLVAEVLSLAINSILED